MNYATLSSDIKLWATELGFSECGITDVDLSVHENHLLNWLKDGFHGEMNYMEKHGTRRSRPADLEPGTTRIISVRMNYFPDYAKDAHEVLGDSTLGYISRYALGRDYHKMMRKKLQALANRIETYTGPYGYRAFVDSAPVLEKAIAEKAGLGWIGKHSNLLTRQGSWFFLGEIYTDLPLVEDPPTQSEHCGSCTACITACPTGAIVAPYRVDARLCISYLTIESKSSIPIELRSLMGNRIYGCDDCQLFCPWNKFTQSSQQPDFEPRHSLDKTPLTELFSWSESQFLKNTEGSAIRRIGYECWLRNIAVALGNSPTTSTTIAALEARRQDASGMVREHTLWALDKHNKQ